MTTALNKKTVSLAPTDSFIPRHVGPAEEDVREMLRVLGLQTLDDLIRATVPESIRRKEPLEIGPPRGEQEVLDEIRELASRNQVFRSFIGMGYYDTITPPPILRNILENPGWYTQYTPYQAEIAQGRLEALLNFQTLVADLTALPLANASLLDEATAAAEAMHMAYAIAGGDHGERARFFVSEDCHPQTLAVVKTRARSLGIPVDVGAAADLDVSKAGAFGVLVQYPTTDGKVVDYKELSDRVHAARALLVVAADPLALTLLRPPGEFGADIAVGSMQRFGVPMGFGGPHAAYLATREESSRRMPGRIVGISKDAHGRPAYRLAIQTREQHIRRDKATSNICTAQVLLAVMASMYAVYHGPEGLRRIAERVHALTLTLAAGLRRLGFKVAADPSFDTIRVPMADDTCAEVHAAARGRRMNLRPYADGSIGVSIDETATVSDVKAIWEVFARGAAVPFEVGEVAEGVDVTYEAPFARTSSYLTHEVFQRYHSEHEILRYMHRLESRDLSLTTSMIPLGSCTMKLNGTTEMIPVSWPQLARMHPFAPFEQTAGYQELFRQLEAWLSEITGFTAVSLQPNAGSQGEYAGLLAIRGYHEAQGEPQRTTCLIPVSAHGTNPASAVMAGFKVVVVSCDERGNVDVSDLKSKAETHRDTLGALMITYPSTHGVFEEAVSEICDVVHANGGQVYMDGANLNAQVGLSRPSDIGADVCHLNLHKTFCIPHGGGGPGMGPIAVTSHLAPFLPGHPEGAVSAAPYGSAGILPISWAYIRLMGGEGLKRATEVAILSANYMAKRLEGHYQTLYTGARGRVAHEFIIDCRPFKKSAGIEAEDIAKRLMDYGFHAPTMSFPVAGTLMIEPTESESKAELDRFCEAMISIREEIRAIEEGRAEREGNVLKNAPHTAAAVASDAWPHPYSRAQAAFPLPWIRENKFWPFVGRIDNTYGDRNLVCTCQPVAAYES